VKAILSVLRTQGVVNPTLDGIIRFIGAKKRHKWQIGPAPPDAAVDRSRSTIATDFIEHRDADVLVMMDHDIQVPNPADLEYLAEKALELEGIVGAVVSKRALGLGFGCSFVDGEEHELFSDEVVELGPGGYMGGACTAYHRSVFTALVDAGMELCSSQGFYPFFLPCVVPHPETGEPFYLSEDWAVCHYLREFTDKKVYAAMRPYVVHYGQYGFSPLDGNRRDDS
jgi:hypothetical protein